MASLWSRIVQSGKVLTGGSRAQTAQLTLRNYSDKAKDKEDAKPAKVNPFFKKYYQKILAFAKRSPKAEAKATKAAADAAKSDPKAKVKQIGAVQKATSVRPDGAKGR